MYETRISKGIEFLKQEYPGWRDDVNWEELDMYNYCVLDQVDEGGYTGVVDLHADGPRMDWAVRHGFDLYADEAAHGGYKKLRDEWKEVVS